MDTPLPIGSLGLPQTQVRTPPHSDEAEMALLGALLHNNATYEKVSEFLKPMHFANRLHGRLYDAIGRLIERGQIADPITLKHAFSQDPDLDGGVGTSYLMQLAASVTSVINAPDYARAIFDLYLRRQLIDLGETVVNDAFVDDLERDAKRQIEEAEARLFSLAETGETEGGFKAFKIALKGSLQTAEAAYRRDGGLSGAATGLDSLDHLLGGLHQSDLIILAGRPSMGKTALATNIAFNIAASDADPHTGRRPVVGFFSLEMSAEQLATRILAEQTEIPSERLRRGELSNDDFDRMVEASQRLERLGLFIDDTPALTVQAVRTRARRLKRQQDGLTLVVVDYLQLLRGSSRAQNENRVQEISEITRGLKAIAKELEVPVVALSQLSRAVEQREDKRPQLADLRESGSIEQDADIVMFVFREEYYLARAEPMQRPEEDIQKYQERHNAWKQRCEAAYALAEVIVAKQRHGPIGRVTLRFDGDTTRFSNYVSDDHLPASYE
ncbi:MAG: replicative DNA helicase [Alphaproteobacteria bacterium]|nr:replicative DNA helicase [Alphaproteobacteria bacterium]TAD91963.1 MAG: replicative DNA helicase [Alphaproteobacteria bacterium]